MKVEKISKIMQLLVDLEWVYDRMSSSGQDSLDKMFKLFGMRTHDEVQEIIK